MRLSSHELGVESPELADSFVFPHVVDCLNILRGGLRLPFDISVD